MYTGGATPALYREKSDPTCIKREETTIPYTYVPLMDIFIAPLIFSLLSNLDLKKVNTDNT